MRYADFRPTSFDGHLPVDDREDWIVVPCSRTRDSGVLDESNFASALAGLGGESGTVEVHRSGHWGPGWFEIILVDPARAAEVAEIEMALAGYPVLDGDDLSRREVKAEEEAWRDWVAGDVRRALCKAFALGDATVTWLTDDRLWDLYQSRSSGTEHSDEGPHFSTTWIKVLDRDALARWVRETRARERRDAAK
jgi:hypothetical protein